MNLRINDTFVPSLAGKLGYRSMNDQQGIKIDFPHSRGIRFGPGRTGLSDRSRDAAGRRIAMTRGVCMTSTDTGASKIRDGAALVHVLAGRERRLRVAVLHLPHGSGGGVEPRRHEAASLARPADAWLSPNTLSRARQ